MEEGEGLLQPAPTPADLGESTVHNTVEEWPPGGAAVQSSLEEGGVTEIVCNSN